MNFFVKLLLVVFLVLGTPFSKAYAPELRSPKDGLNDLVRFISQEFKKEEKLVRQIIEEVRKRTPMPSLSEAEPNVPFPSAIDVLAVIAQESRFDPKAEGLPGPSVGLMQIHAPSHGRAATTGISANIEKGTKLLVSYSSDVPATKGLVRYNAGPTKAKKICPPNRGYASCTSPYVKKVFAWRKKFLQVYSTGVIPISQS